MSLLEVRPCLMALREEVALPESESGPWERAPLAREVSARLLMIEVPFSKESFREGGKPPPGFDFGGGGQGATAGVGWK